MNRTDCKILVSLCLDVEDLAKQCYEQQKCNMSVRSKKSVSLREITKILREKYFSKIVREKHITNVSRNGLLLK